MRAFIHAFQGQPWNEECEVALRGFEKLGVECVLFATNEELDRRTPADIVVGGTLIMEHVLKEMGLDPPAYDYPENLNRYLEREIRIVKVRNLRQETLPFFVKPVREKVAKGIVVSSYDDLSEYDKLDPEDYAFISEVLSLVSEWRCFIRYGEILGIQHYNGDEEVGCSRDFLERVLSDYNDSPAAFALDFGITNDGKTVLIEMNDGFAIGCYGLPDELYAKFLSARWAELTGAIDPWNLCLRKGYVEAGIKSAEEKVWNAF